MKAVSINEIHFTPWHLRDRTRSFRHDLAKTVQSNFFYSFLFLPKAKRDAIIDVYRFCRAVDDIVDEIGDDFAETGGTIATAQQALNNWRAEVVALYAGKPSLPLAQSLDTVLQQFPMPQLYFEEMISGCAMDLKQNRYQTFDELYQYCYRVASITGLMCIEIFTYTNTQTKDYAINLGLALQLTNILRDIKEDAGRNRVYLPQEDLQMFGYSERELFDGVLNDNFRALMRFECERARGFYQRAAELLPTEDRSTLVAARTMGKIYFRLLEEIERADYDVFHHQVRLHRPERFLIALNEWAFQEGETERQKDGEKPRSNHF